MRMHGLRVRLDSAQEIASPIFDLVTGVLALVVTVVIIGIGLCVARKLRESCGKVLALG